MKLVWMLLVFTQTLSLPSDAIEAPISTDPQTALDLQRVIPSTEAIVLGDGAEKFLSLQKTAMTADRKGTVILVPDWSQHAASPRSINYLRKLLIDYGWDTISILVPEPLPDTNEDQINHYQKVLQQRMSVIMQQALAKPGGVIVIAQGSSGALMNQLYMQETIPTPQALVILGSYLNDWTLHEAALPAIALHSIPTLDILQDQDHPYAIASSKLRQQLVKKNSKSAYRQRIWPAGAGDQNPWLGQELLGWFRQLGY